MEPAPDGSQVLVYRREPAAEDVYIVTSWHGLALYQCRWCAFDTMDAANMFAHLDGCKGAGSEPVVKTDLEV